jgi:arsenate reductase (thioredoxin)
MRNAVSYFFDSLYSHIALNRLIKYMSDIMYKVLFVCIHNSARSQMAEAFLKKWGGERYVAESAGLEPGTMNPNVVTVMQEVGIDLSQKGTQGVFDLFRKGATYDGVITVCDGASAERCPVFPGKSKRIVWSFEDPSSMKGSREEVLQNTRKIRDGIEEKVKEFVKESGTLSYWI